MSNRTADEQQRHDMLQLLKALELISYGTTASWSPSGGGDTEKGGGRPAGGDTRPLHDISAERFNGAATVTDRERVLNEARAELGRERVSQADRSTDETAEQLTARIRDLRRQGWPIKEVALHCRCTPTRVRQAEADHKADQVLELAGKGMTLRQIETITGVAKSTAQRILKAAA